MELVIVSLKKVMEEKDQEIRLNKLHWFTKKMFIAGVIISLITILLAVVVKAGAYRILSMRMPIFQTLIIIYFFVSVVFLLTSFIVKRVNPNHEKSFYRWAYFYDLYDFFMKCLCVLMLVMVYAFCFVRVKGQSMDDTYHNNDILIVKTVGYKPKVNDVAIVYRSEINDLYIKRIVAGPGDTVSYKNRTLFVNDNVVVEFGKTPLNCDDYVTAYTSFVLGEEEYFIVGDNYTNSIDSRKFGPVLRKDILGKAFFKFF